MPAHHRAVTVTNRDIDAQLVGLQSVLSTVLGRKVGLQVALDYLLQNFTINSEGGTALELDDFETRIEGRRPR